MKNPESESTGQALGRLPSGLYIASVRRGSGQTGMLASWVQQAGFRPPMVTVAVARGRFLADWIAEEGGFTLCQIAAGGKSLMKHFSRGFAPEDDAFDGLAILEGEQTAGPVPADALAYLDCRVVGSMDSDDHRIFLARVEHGRMIRDDAEPFVHIRRNGFHY